MDFLRHGDALIAFSCAEYHNIEKVVYLYEQNLCKTKILISLFFVL